MTSINLPKLLFFTTGLPGAGKTQFCLNLLQHSNVEHVSLDRIAFQLYRHHPFYKESERNVVLGEAEYRVEELLHQNKPVIYDGTVNTDEWRDRLKAFAEKQKITLVCIYIQVPVEVARQRASTPRYDPVTGVWRMVTEAQFKQKLDDFEEPDFKNKLVLSGTDPFDKQLDALATFVHKLAK